MVTNKISTQEPVLVTGASGFVAGWIVKALLEAGVHVHATLRDPSDQGKLHHLVKIAENAPGRLSFFRADLLEKGSFDAAMAGCSIIFHTASPFILDINDAERDLIAPARDGTCNVLEAVNRTKSVQRVVLTSSCAAIYGDVIDCAGAPRNTLNEELWNESSSATHQPYSYSKTIAERAAWDMAIAQDHWQLVTVNPAFVLGPTLSGRSSSATHALLKKLGDGQLKSGVPFLEFGTTDVRDVADAHIAAAYTAHAKGRYIIFNEVLRFFEIAEILRAHFGADWPFPKRELPKWMVWLLGPIFDKMLTRKVVTRNVGHSWRADNSKAISELGLKYRPVDNAITEAFQQMIDEGVFA